MLAHARIALLGFLLIAMQAKAAPDAEYWAFWDQHGERSGVDVPHTQWQSFLDQNLVADHPSGISRFAYGKVSATSRGELQRYLQQLQSIDPRKLTRAQQFAYWINLYNALTVDLVLEEYPVSSIRKIRPHFFAFGPWDMDVAKVAGQTLTLNDIEHRILRPIFGDPRIHFAVNCASLGCPNLLGTAYRSDNVNDLLDEATRLFLQHERAMRWQGDELHVSSIFDWFASDFGGSSGVLQFLRRYAPAGKKAQLQGFNGSVEYHYDWALNDLP